MKKLFLGAAILALAVSSQAQDSAMKGMQVGFYLGGASPLGGDSFLEEFVAPGLSEVRTYKDDFKMGIAWGGYAAGPISGMIGWRVEAGRDSIPPKKGTRFLADQFDSFDANHHVFRFSGGLQLAPWQTEEKGMPYGFFTIGLARESASIDTTVGIVNTHYDLGASNSFGASFGGGYNYNIGPNYGIGGDLHINVGKFDDATRWSMTPSVVGFYRF